MCSVRIHCVSSVLNKGTRIWIAATALTAMEAEGKRRCPLETGGILVGYRATDSQVITEVIGPGPLAIRTEVSFLADHLFQCDQLDMRFRQSGGTLIYLGDWHTHPDGAPGMSALDQKTLRHICGHGPARCLNPVMIIGGGGPDKWHWKAHVYERRALVRHFISPSIAVFDPAALSP